MVRSVVKLICLAAMTIYLFFKMPFSYINMCNIIKNSYISINHEAGVEYHVFTSSTKCAFSCYTIFFKQKRVHCKYICFLLMTFFEQLRENIVVIIMNENNLHNILHFLKILFRYLIASMFNTFQIICVIWILVHFSNKLLKWVLLGFLNK